MASLYTPAVREFIKSRPWPKKLKWEVLEYSDHLKLIFFRDNWITLDPDDRWRVVAIVREVMEKVRADGIPIVFDRIMPGEGGTGGR